MKQIQISVPYVSKTAQSNVREVMRGDWLSPNGPMSTRFVNALEDRYSARVVLTNSGTSALEIALIAMGKVYGIFERFAKRGYKPVVIVPDHTCPDCAIACVKAGYDVMFADVSHVRNGITVETLETAVSKVAGASDRVVGVMLVSMYGMTVDVEVYKKARELGLFILNDDAESFTCQPEGYDPLTLADVVCTSLRGEKPFPVGTGGVIWTRHSGVYGVARSLVGLNSLGGFNRLNCVETAYSYEFPELLSAFGLGQLDEFDQHLALRWENIKLYEKNGVDGTFEKGDIPWKLPVWVDDAFDAWTDLKRQGIETTPPLTPISKMPFTYGNQAGKAFTPVAHAFVNQLLLLPCHSLMSVEDIERVANAIKPHLAHVLEYETEVYGQIAIAVDGTDVVNLHSDFLSYGSSKKFGSDSDSELIFSAAEEEGTFLVNFRKKDELEFVGKAKSGDTVEFDHLGDPIIVPSKQRKGGVIKSGIGYIIGEEDGFDLIATPVDPASFSADVGFSIEEKVASGFGSRLVTTGDGETMSIGEFAARIALQIEEVIEETQIRVDDVTATKIDALASEIEKLEDAVGENSETLSGGLAIGGLSSDELDRLRLEFEKQRANEDYDVKVVANVEEIADKFSQMANKEGGSVITGEVNDE